MYLLAGFPAFQFPGIAEVDAVGRGVKAFLAQLKGYPGIGKEYYAIEIAPEKWHFQAFAFGLLFNPHNGKIITLGYAYAQLMVKVCNRL